jgi:hypothetical protein
MNPLRSAVGFTLIAALSGCSQPTAADSTSVIAAYGYWDDGNFSIVPDLQFAPKGEGI